MKKLFFALSFFCALVSCTKELQSVNETEGTTETLFVGSSESVKVAVGDKEGNVYKAVWSEGDQIYIIDATKQELTVLGTADLVSGAGETSGTFSTKAELTDGAKVKIAYGITSIPAEQTQDASGAKDLTKITGAMSEEITLSLGGTNSFTLVHTPAIVKVNVSTSAFAGMNLESVMLYSKGAKLSGDGQTTGDYVCVTFKNPVASDKVQEAWFTTLPVATPTDFYAVATFKGTYNSIPGTTVTIPVKFTGKTLASNKVISIPMTDLTLDSNTEASWYEPVETRDLLGMYAYGAENTYYVEQKSTDNSIVFDVKARGDFRKVKAPKYYGLYTSTSQNGDGKYLFYLPNGTKIYEAKPTTQVNANCEATVKCYSTGQLNKGHWATIAIYDNDYDLLWSFMLCRYLTDDPLCDVTYSEGFTLLDRPLGAAFSSAYINEKGDKSGNNQYAFFEWGRKDPFMWSNGSDGIKDGRFNQIVVTKDTDIEYTIKHPGIIVGYTSSIADGYWCTEKRNDLWGGQASTTNKDYDTNVVGHKTIYDPCPAGYRVCDPKVFAAVKANAVHHEVSNGNANQDAAWINPLKNCDSSYLTCTDTDGNLDLWVFGGAHWGSSNSWGNRTGNTKNMGALYWSNSYYGHEGRGIMLQDVYFSKTISVLDTYDSNMAQAYGVRCQKM